MRNSFIFRALFLLFFGLEILVAQHFVPEVKLVHYAESDGLSSGVVFEAYQDSRGFIWLATGNGIDCTDGKHFYHLGDKDGVPDPAVLNVVGEDSAGTVWFFSMTADLIGVTRSMKVILHPASQIIRDHFQSGVNIYPSINPDGSFNINLFTSGNSLRIKNEDTTEFFANDVGLSDVVLWETLSRHPVKISNESVNAHRALQKIFLHTIKGERRVISIGPKLTFHGQTRFWMKENLVFGVNRNIAYVFNNDGRVDSLDFKTSINDMYLDRHKNLWVATESRGVFMFPEMKLTGSPKLHLLNHRSVGRIIEDYTGGYWIPTIGDGLYYLSHPEIKGQLFARDEVRLSVDHLAASSIRLIYTQAKGEIMVYQGGISTPVMVGDEPNEMAKSYFQIHYQAALDRFIVSSNITKANIVKGNQAVDIDNEIGAALSFAEYDSVLIRGAWANVRLFDSKSLRPITPRFDKYKVRANALLSLGSDSILVGSLDGLHFIKMSGKDTVIAHEARYRKCKIKRMIRHENAVILTTGNQGIKILSLPALDSIAQLDETHGLATNNAHAVIPYRNGFFISSALGIHYFSDYANLINGHQEFLLGKSGGLLSEKVFELAIMRDTLFAATGEGLCIYPLSILFQKMTGRGKPSIFITQVKIDDRRIDQLGRIDVPQESKITTIYFSAIDLAHRQDVVYRYKLTGYAEEWRESDLNYAEYGQLLPGTYNFMVEYSPDHGNTWIGKTEIVICKQPKFYQTWWFYMLLFLTCTGGFYYLIHVMYMKKKLRQLKKARTRLQMRTVELKSLRAQMNPHFVFNVISSIQHYILENESKKAYTYLSTFAKLMRSVLNSMDRKDNSIRFEITWLTQYLDLEQMRFKDRFEYTIEVDETIDTEHTMIPSMLLQPIVENAIKHGLPLGEARGRIELKFERISEGIRISVIDNGIGINAALLQKSTDHQSRATGILKERVLIYNQIAGYEKIHVSVNDRGETNPKETGTQVDVTLVAPSR